MNLKKRTKLQGIPHFLFLLPDLPRVSKKKKIDEETKEYVGEDDLFANKDSLRKQ